jgi:hypothetical protein
VRASTNDGSGDRGQATAVRERAGASRKAVNFLRLTAICKEEGEGGENL